MDVFSWAVVAVFFLIVLAHIGIYLFLGWCTVLDWAQVQALHSRQEVGIHLDWLHSFKDWVWTEEVSCLEFYSHSWLEALLLSWILELPFDRLLLHFDLYIWIPLVTNDCIHTLLDDWSKDLFFLYLGLQIRRLEITLAVLTHGFVESVWEGHRGNHHLMLLKNWESSNKYLTVSSQFILLLFHNI